MITLSDIAVAVKEVDMINEAITLLTDEIARLSKKKALIEEETIPSSFFELGIKSIKLEDGRSVKVNLDVYSSLANDNKPVAYRWLAEHNFGGLIKVQIVANYSKGEREKAEQEYAKLIEAGVDAGLKEDVHHSTLASFLREQIKAGNDLPLDIFGARSVFRTKIK